MGVLGKMIPRQGASGSNTGTLRIIFAGEDLEVCIVCV